MSYLEELADLENRSVSQAVRDLVFAEMEPADQEIIDLMGSRGYTLAGEDGDFQWVNPAGNHSLSLSGAQAVLDLAQKILYPIPGVNLEWEEALDRPPVAHSLPSIEEENPATPAAGAQVCRDCGCTDEKACEGGCTWVEPDLCSACKQIGHDSGLSGLVSEIAIAKIRRDGGTQSRCELDLTHVADLAEAYTKGKTMPPVTLYWDSDGNYFLADGFHRVAAAEAAGLSIISCEVQNGTQREAVLASLGANADHGLKRSTADKRKAVCTMFADEEWRRWSNIRIAEVVGVSDTYVGNIRKELEASGELEPQTVRAGKGGRITDTAAIGKAKDPESAEPPPLLADQPPVPMVEPPLTYYVDAQEFDDSVSGSIAESLSDVTAAGEVIGDPFVYAEGLYVATLHDRKTTTDPNSTITAWRCVPLDDYREQTFENYDAKRKFAPAAAFEDYEGIIVVTGAGTEYVLSGPPVLFRRKEEEIESAPASAISEQTRAAVIDPPKPPPPAKPVATIEDLLKGRKMIVGLTWIPGLAGLVQLTVNVGDNATEAARVTLDAADLRPLPNRVMEAIAAQIRSDDAAQKAKPTVKKTPPKKTATRKPATKTAAKKPAAKKPAPKAKKKGA